MSTNRVVEGLLEANVLPTPSTVLEPAAGRGAIVRRLRTAFERAVILGVEIQPQFQAELEACCDQVKIGDFLTADITGTFDLVVTNPPFSLAQPFVEKALTLLKPRGVAAFLLRLSFAASVKRYEFFRDHRPSQILLLSQRPKFGGDNIDSCDYAWFVWRMRPSPITEFRWVTPA